MHNKDSKFLEVLRTFSLNTLQSSLLLVHVKLSSVTIIRILYIFNDIDFYIPKNLFFNAI